MTRLACTSLYTSSNFYLFKKVEKNALVGLLIFNKIIHEEINVKIDGTSDANNFSGKSTPRSAVGALATERVSTQFFGLTPTQTVSGSAATFDEVQQVQQCVTNQAVSAVCAAAVQVSICVNYIPYGPLCSQCM